MSDQEKLRMCKEEISKIRDRIKKEIQEKDRKMKKGIFLAYKILIVENFPIKIMKFILKLYII